MVKVGLFCRNAHVLKRQAEQATVSSVAMLQRDIDERMPGSRQLPVKHTDDAWLGRMEHRVADAKVAMAQRDGVALRHALGEPHDKAVEIRVVVVAAAKLRPLP